MRPLDGTVTAAESEWGNQILFREEATAGSGENPSLLRRTKPLTVTTATSFEESEQGVFWLFTKEMAMANLASTCRRRYSGKETTGSQH